MLETESVDFAVLPHGISMNAMPSFIANGPPFAGSSFNGNNSVVNMMIGNGCMAPGGIMQPISGSSRMAGVQLNQQMPMTHLRPLTRFDFGHERVIT